MRAGCPNVAAMSPLRRVHAITLDVGGTLIEPWPSVGHVYAEVAAQHGVWPVDVDELNRRFGAAWRARRDFHHTPAEWFDLVRQTFGTEARRLPGTFFPAVYARFEEPGAWRLCPDALPALDALASRGVRLGVISNWDERLEPLLRALRLRSFFEVVTVSCDVGFTKPSSVIFEQAVRKFGLPAGRILHVGDSAREDAEGASGAGLQALHLDRSRTTAPKDGRIAALTELDGLVGVAAPAGRP
ncbi:MAG: HAD-IA family hydrolase [Verrucomicrobia bacterium]|nr:HAD-IA family hydrolase [Verrucomicrobiota bacterium]